MERLFNTAVRIAKELDNSLKEELYAGGHVRTGRLLRSIKTRVRVEGDWIVLSTSMEHYGVILNRRFRFAEKTIGNISPYIKNLLGAAIRDIIEKEVKEHLQ